MNQKPSQMSRDLFIDIFGSVYEYSRWIAEQVFDSGLTSSFDGSSILFAAPRKAVAPACEVQYVPDKMGTHFAQK